MPTANEKQLVALERVHRTLREEENADVLIETTLNHLKTEFEYNLIWIGLYDRLDHRLFGKGGITPQGDTTLLKTKFFLNPGDLLEQVVIQQRPVSVPDLREEVRAGEWRRAAQQFGIQGTLLFPLRCKDRCYGVVLLGSYQWGFSPSTGEKAHLSLLFGGLASALYQIEVDWQRSSTKRPDQALFQALDQITKAATMQQRLEAVVSTTQQFVAPTRSSLYWFEPQGRYFWHRIGNQRNARAIANSLTGSSGLLVQEVNEFYLALVAGQTVAIGAGRSPLKAEVTGRLMKRLRARSLLAAPIIVLKELVGFLTVEGNEPRIWEQVETNYVRAAASLVAMVAESESATKAHEQSVANTRLVAQVASAIANNTDSQAALQQCAKVLLERLGVERFLLLKEDTLKSSELGVLSVELKENNTENSSSSTQNSVGTGLVEQEQLNFPANKTKPAPTTQNSRLPLQIVYQHVSVPNRRAITAFLPALSAEDAQALFANVEGKVQSNEVASVYSSVVAIEDWEEDERLSDWKSALMQVGVRSLLVCRIASPQTVGLLVLCHGTPRTWNRAEQELVGIVSQQIALMWQIKSFQTLAQLESSSQQTLQSGLNALLSFPEDLDGFERAFIAFLAELLACPLAALLRWNPEKPLAEVAVAVVASPSFALPPDLAIHPGQDPLIQEALTTDGLLERRLKDLSPATRRWISSTSTGCLLVMALPDFGLPLAKRCATGHFLDFRLGLAGENRQSSKTNEFANNPKSSLLAARSAIQNPKSIVLLADQAQRQWPRHLLPVVETLVRQFALVRHYLGSCDALDGEVIDLQQLNWYKHKCLETFHHAVKTSIDALVELPLPKDMRVSESVAAPYSADAHVRADGQPVAQHKRQEVQDLALQDEAARGKKGAAWSLNPSSPLQPSIPALQQNSTPESLRLMRSSQLLHQLENTLVTLSPLLNQEQWQFSLTLTQIPLAILLKRSLLLLTPLTKQQQISTTVHIASTERVCGDRLKLDCVLFELLLSTARSCPTGGRINIWCRPITSHKSQVTSQQEHSRLTSSSPSSSVLEVLITDKIAPKRMNAEPIHLSEDPNSLNLKICQRVVRSWGGDLQFYQLSKGQYTSRLLLPRPS